MSLLLLGGCHVVVQQKSCEESSRERLGLHLGTTDASISNLEQFFHLIRLIIWGTSTVVNVSVRKIGLPTISTDFP